MNKQTNFGLKFNSQYVGYQHYSFSPKENLFHLLFAAAMAFTLVFGLKAKKEEIEFHKAVQQEVQHYAYDPQKTKTPKTTQMHFQNYSCKREVKTHRNRLCYAGFTDHWIILE